MTTLTVPCDCEVSSSEQAASDVVATAARRAAMVRFMGGPVGRGFSAEEVGHVDGDGAGGTAGRAGPAVPALVDVHEGLAVLGVDGQRVQRTDLDAEGAALDAQRFVDGDGHVDALVDLGHHSPLTRLP